MTTKDLRTMTASVLASMREYMADGDAGYGEADVVRCGEILEQCIAAAAQASAAVDYLAAVEAAVKELNTLNAECEHGLIETMERESICEVIIQAGAARGFNDEDEDITEQWREW